MLDYRETTSRSQEMMNRIHDAAEKRDLIMSATEGENPSITRHITGVIAAIRGKLFSENADKNNKSTQSAGRPISGLLIEKE